MMKKIITIAAAGTMLAAAAMPALAYWHRHSDDTVISNSALITNNTLTLANTGLNRGGSTGSARAVATVTNDVNYTNIGCNCTRGDLTVRNNAMVMNNTVTAANSGLNGGHYGRGYSRTVTGNAVADSMVTNLVNTTIVGGSVQP